MHNQYKTTITWKAKINPTIRKKLQRYTWMHITNKRGLAFFIYLLM